MTRSPKHTRTAFRVSLPLALVALLVLPLMGWGQQELRSGKKGNSNPAPITSTSIDADHQALDVNVAGGTLGNVTISNADGAINDGVNNTIKGTVLDLTNSNPVTTAIVDANGTQITSFGGGTQYQQGDASTTTDTMTMAGCVRVDTPAVAAGVIDGDRARCIVDSTNRMWVHVGVIDGTVGVTQSGTWNLNALTSITNPVASTQSGTWTVQPGNTANTTPWLATIAQGGNSATVNGSGQLAVNCANCSGSGVSQQDNTGFTPGTTNFVPLGGEVDDTATATVTENNAGAARITPQRSLHTNLRNNSGVEIGIAAAPLRTDPTGTTTQPVSGTVTANAGTGTFTIQSNASVNVAQMNGVATSMGVGASGTGTQRVASLLHDGTDTAQVTATGGGSLQVECAAGCSGGTQYAEDSIHASGDQLTMAGVVQQSATAALAADGDRTALQVDSNGHLKVVNANPNLAADNSTNSTAKVPVIAALAGSAAPTWTSGNQVPLSVDTSGALRVTGGTAATQFNEDAASAGGEAMTLAGTIRQDTPTGTTSLDGDYANLKTDSVGRLWVNGSGVTQPVSGTITANAGTGTFNIQANASVNNAQIGGVAISAGNGVSGTGVQRVTIASDSTGVVGVTQATASSLNAQVVGSVAHDGVDAGNPVKIGCQARTTNRTAVADADRADCISDKNGQLIVTQSAPRERVVRSGVVTLTTTTETTLLAAGGAGVFRDITYLKCTNNSATLVRVDLRDATAGTVIDSWALAASGGGFNLAFPVPYAQATANNNWTVQLSSAVTDVRCSAQAVEKN